MAFMMNINKEVYGVTLTFNKAYHKVTDVRGDKDSVTATLKIYTDDTKQIELDTKLLTFAPDKDENSLRWDKQAYEYAKTLETFFGAVDC